MHLLWWGAGIVLYGVGTLTESWVTLVGWHPYVFKLWYISGALLGGALLAQGTVYLLARPKVAQRWTRALIVAVTVASTAVILSPLNHTLVQPHHLSGKVFEWQWVRYFSPFINTYAFIFLVGGAVISAMRYKKSPKTRHRYLGNIFIAVGALLPGIGGTFTRLGYTEVLYVTEFIGLVLIYNGFLLSTRHRTQKKEVGLKGEQIP